MKLRHDNKKLMNYHFIMAASYSIVDGHATKMIGRYENKSIMDSTIGAPLLHYNGEITLEFKHED